LADERTDQYEEPGLDEQVASEPPAGEQLAPEHARSADEVGGPGTGANNSYATNELAARMEYADSFIQQGRAEDAGERGLVRLPDSEEAWVLPARRAEGGLGISNTHAAWLGEGYGTTCIASRLPG